MSDSGRMRSNERNAIMAKHMNEADRCRIELLLGLRWTVSEIARDRGRPESTIIREILNRRVPCDRGYGCSNRVCANFETCSRKGCGPERNREFRCTPKCYSVCPEFREAVCTRLGSSPYVCNGCDRFHNCPLKKRLYVAKSAQANYTGTLRESRSGVHPDDALVARMNRVLSPCILRRQSVRHVMASNPGVFRGIAERTVYGYIESGLFDVGGSDLPEAGRRRPRGRKAETKTNAKCRVGRTYEEFLAYREANPGTPVVEMDTVVGRNGGKVLFTFQFTDCRLMLAFLREARSSQTCTRIFNLLHATAGDQLYRELFPIVLTDNGSEFSDPDMVENYRPDPVHNSTKVVPRGTRLFYCNSFSSWQKAHVENNHRLVRRVLEHGTSFDELEQEDICTVMSNVNSYTRGAGNDGRTIIPYDEFVRLHGERGKAFLDALGIVRVPANEVTLDPILLGKRFKRHAEKVVLDRYGVKRTSQTTAQK